MNSLSSLAGPHNEAIRFYCGLGEKHYNHHPVVTGPYACVSPVSGSQTRKVNSVAVPQGVLVLQDSLGPSTRPVKKDRQTGYAMWGYASWCNNAYPVPPVLASCKVLDASGGKAPTCTPETRCRGLERARHVLLTYEWFAHFRTREPRLYRAPCYQLSWLECTS
ncbi:MAG TPA: hypothetical protein VFB60_11465 [Ktedonobacteraceae bacterium]|nr:hypothetical protein [Ktedonobacteraceae bacterium]